MGNVIKMELYRLSRSASFYVNLLLVFVLSFAIAPVGQLTKKLLLAIGSSEAENRNSRLKAENSPPTATCRLCRARSAVRIGAPHR